MKRFLLVTLLFSFVFLWCTKNTVKEIDVNAIADLTTLQEVIAQVSQEMGSGTINMEEAQNLLDQLQQKYVDLTDITQKTIENQFGEMQKAFDKQSIASYTLPLRARKLWMTVPRWMEIDKVLSKQTIVNDSGYSSTILVYKWNYTIAMQQAKSIAQRARLSVSKGFEKAQSLAKSGDVNYISGLDISDLSKWIVYVNHELLDTNIDYLLSVSVDQDGTLIIEATKYQNN